MTFICCDGRTESSMFCALLDLRSCRKEGFQENPEARRKATSSEAKIRRFAGGNETKQALKKIP